MGESSAVVRLQPRPQKLPTVVLQLLVHNSQLLIRDAKTIWSQTVSQQVKPGMHRIAPTMLKPQSALRSLQSQILSTKNDYMKRPLWVKQPGRLLL
jgi:hypothetical protein